MYSSMYNIQIFQWEARLHFIKLERENNLIFCLLTRREKKKIPRLYIQQSMEPKIKYLLRHGCTEGI